MSLDKFSVSIKGIICKNSKVLLRKNQRKEYELIGGKLDINDISPQERLCKEFYEESGAFIDVLGLRHPWLYLIGSKNILIVPYICELSSIDTEHTDEDGGQIAWLDKNDIDSLFLPVGYNDSISGRIPRTSFSPIEGDFFKIIPNYKESDYYVKVTVASIKGIILLDRYLTHYISPIDLIQQGLNGVDIELLYPLELKKSNDTVTIKYIYLGQN